MKKICYFNKINKKKLKNKMKEIILTILRLKNYIGHKRIMQLIFIMILMIISSLAEIISIGSIVPFLALLTAPENFINNNYVLKFIPNIGEKNIEEIIYIATCLFISFTILAATIRVLLIWSINKIGFLTGADLSINIYSHILYQPYCIHLKRNTSEIISGIMIKVHSVISGVLIPTLTLISALFLLIPIIMTLIIVDPIMATICTFIFGISYSFIAFINRKNLINNSKKIAKEQTEVVRMLQEGLGGIRDVILSGTQQLYCQIYREADKNLKLAQAENAFLAQFPRYIIEAIGMILIVVSAYYFHDDKGNLASAMPILGAFALGAQRLLPAFQQIYNSWAYIEGNYNAVIDIIEIFKTPTYKNNLLNVAEEIKFEKDITLNNIFFKYSTNEPWIINGVFLKINKGEKIGFTGISGSGKSTLLDILMGLLPPTSGELQIDGRSLTEVQKLNWFKNIAHVPQNIFLTDASFAENIAFGISKKNVCIASVKEAAKKAQIHTFIESNSEGYNTIVGERGIRLSGGQRQRIGIARALYRKATVLVLDEATSSLDNDTEESVMSSISNLRNDLTILIIAHRLSTVRMCDKIIELGNGNLTIQK